MTSETSKTTRYVDHLDEDVVKCGDLRYALISFVTKDGRQRMETGDKIGLKIRGAFATKEEADAHSKRLMKTDVLFDVYLVDMYQWLMLPAPTEIDDVRYQEEYLNTMVKEYKESQLLAKQHFEERKQKIMEDGLLKHLSEEEKLPPPPLEELENDVHATASGSG